MELWSGTQKNVAPLKLRWTIAKYAPRFNGFQQQDSQELLAFLLDGLHEDLNRVHEKPYVELNDSNGRPDWEVASEVRVQSINQNIHAQLHTHTHTHARTVNQYTHVQSNQSLFTQREFSTVNMEKIKPIN
ncbi:unnamed protein product [Oncorhynchus mykiss]|uniref:ubiquitinyl hydrolase 1 n=1 Tax=Oncorhynchus mykiss TaxID=8022 RepID=A0A060YVV9_ONCMY|nr:unnamed protein product [Oncorhynchus mykiss]